MNKDIVEYYEENYNTPIVTVQSSIVPILGSKISIAKTTWLVVNITYAIDHSAKPQEERITKANIDLRLWKKPRE